MSTILLSFEPDWFNLIESGVKKFEYRKHFPKGETTVYFYVSAPVKGITGIAKFGERESLEDWVIKYADRSEDVHNRIKDFMSDCRFAMPLLEYQKTNLLPLDQIRNEYPNFIVPRMYYYIDNDPLIGYLHSHLFPVGGARKHTFEVIIDNDIC
jgi:predicted transcriptional regulator